MPDCPFCNLEQKTEWYVHYKSGWIICRDENNRGHHARILVVNTAKHSRQKWDATTCTEIKLLVEAIARAQFPKHKRHTWDWEDHSYNEHYHAQLNID